ncbi:6-phosphofructokinase 2 [Mycolicibacterium sp. BK634]|nr:6-phosphofructokinase 2 [Mycolicibacterium sp. BK634]
MIVTLTMNPALDITVDADEVRPTDKIRCRADRYDAGGGGVNVARFAHALGASATAVLTVGGPTGAHLLELMDAATVSTEPVAVRGVTRQSFTVNESSTGRQFRFVLPGPLLSDDDQARCLSLVDHAATQAEFIVASGSLPPGVPADFYQRVADICQRRHVRLILDTSGCGLRHINSGVYLLKPSLRELQECVGRQLRTQSEQAAAACELIERGVADVIVVSLGAQGALLVTSEEARWFSAVEANAVSGVGAGDAMVAGIVVGLQRGWALDAAVRYGIAAATAKLQTPGTAAFALDEVDRFYDQVARSTVVAPEPLGALTCQTARAE